MRGTLRAGTALSLCWLIFLLTLASSSASATGYLARCNDPLEGPAVEGPALLPLRKLGDVHAAPLREGCRSWNNPQSQDRGR